MNSNENLKRKNLNEAGKEPVSIAKSRLRMNKFRKAMTGLGMFGFPILHFYLLEAYTHNAFTTVRPFSQIFNILLYELTMCLLFFVFQNLKWALRIQAMAAMSVGLINYYVYTFRSLPLVPWDIFSLKTAVSVADNYNFIPTLRVLLVLLGFLLCFFAEGQCAMSLKKWKWQAKVISISAVCLLLFSFMHLLQQEDFQNSHQMYNKLFTPVYMWQVNGFAVTMVMELPYISIESPKDYSRQEVEELLAAYTTKEETAEVYPNLIVIMDEAFSDLSVLGEFATNADYMPFFHWLCQDGQNSSYGNLYVSVCGGNTANTEFEFLTGNTMAFLPQGSVPYQQYIHTEISALPSYLKSLGYETYAMHPYYAGGWDRDTVYPQLGFEHLSFLSDFETKEYIRDYVSDKTCVEKMIDTLEAKPEGVPAFIFNVTMQNHGSYGKEYENFTPDIKVEGADSFALSTYLSLLKKTDEALETLIAYVETMQEPTVVVFFGDHQPNDSVAGPILQLQGKSYQNLSKEDAALRYQVPYLIWANFEIETETEDLSVNYLANKVLETAGIAKSAYGNFLEEIKSRYPVISAQTIRKANGETTELQQTDTWLRWYQKLQYYFLFS